MLLVYSSLVFFSDELPWQSDVTDRNIRERMGCSFHVGKEYPEMPAKDLLLLQTVEVVSIHLSSAFWLLQLLENHFCIFKEIADMQDMRIPNQLWHFKS